MVFSSSARPGSSEPWCATLRISTGGRGRLPVTADSSWAGVRILEDLDRRGVQMTVAVRLGIGREQGVGLPVGGHEDDRVVVRVVARRPGAVRPQDVQREPADAEALSRSRDLDSYSTLV